MLQLSISWYFYTQFGLALIAVTIQTVSDKLGAIATRASAANLKGEDEDEAGDGLPDVESNSPPSKALTVPGVFAAATVSAKKYEAPSKD